MPKIATLAACALAVRGSLALAQTVAEIEEGGELSAGLTFKGLRQQIVDSADAYMAERYGTTPEQQITGLMFRTSVPADTGMLFPWPQPQISEMWMKNTIVPLDMVFIGPDHRIKAIAEDTVPYSLRAISSGVPVIATLELQGGITAADDINVGDKVIAKQLGGG